jgi:serine/threonine protein kinase
MFFSDSRRGRAEAVTNARRKAGAAAEPGDLLQIGELIDGHYEVTEKIGAGGMAQVYLGYDRWLERQVAIKAAPRQLAGHLSQEARVLARLRHPGIVTAHAFGHHRRTPYVVLEYLPGESLTARLIGRGAEPYSIDGALRTVVGICEALVPIHRAGLVHRDLKPGNVMCAEDRVVLIDFGLAWDTRTALSVGHLSGSPPFMAPEVIGNCVRAGEGHLIDVYALGMILYGLVAGATPFADRDPKKVMERQLAEEAPPLSSQRADLPPRLSEVVASLIERDPTRRPADVMSVRDALLGIPRRGADRR